MAKPTVHNKQTLLYDFMHEYGVTPADITVPVPTTYGQPDKLVPLFECERSKGDMLIYYQGLDGKLVQHNNKGTLTTSMRRRLANPFDNNGQLVKYLTVGNNVIYFPPRMLQAYQRKEVIETLIVTEGEKKAFVAAKNGFDCLGISGIWNFCEKPEEEGQQGGLMPSLREYLKTCKVKRVVLLHDSDAMDISTAKNKSATDRPNAFYKSTRRFAELIFQEGVQFFYSYINPHLDPEHKLGLDDLIAKHEDYGQRVLNSFYESVEANKATTYFNTTRIQFLQDGFIKNIFKIGDPKDFYRYHKARLADVKEFRFEGRVFIIDHATGEIEEKKIMGRETVWAENGCYKAYDQKGTPKFVTNFTMNVLFLLKSTNNPKRIVEFKNVLGQSFIAELSMDDLTSVSSFRKKLIAHGSFIYKGEMFELIQISEMLFKEEKNATELVSLGWQKSKGFFAFSNGLTVDGKFFPVDEYGVVSYHNEKFYLPAFSSLYNSDDDDRENERNFRHLVESTVGFQEWAALFYKTYKINGAIGICFIVAALYRDIIFGEFKEFPLICLFGQKGSGKSTMAKSMMYFFGIPQSAISLENQSSTGKGMLRKFSQFRNALVWLDEYKNTILAKTIGTLKNLYDGIGYERAQTSQDNRTHSSPILSSTILSGQDMPTIDPALFTRVLLLMFKQNQFEEADQVNYSALKEMEKTGLTGITIHLLGQRALIEQGYQAEYKKQFARLNQVFKNDDIPDRLLKNVASVLAPVCLLAEAKQIALPFTLDELFTMCTDVLRMHKALLNSNQETAVFWEIVETLFDERIVSWEHGDFKFFGHEVAIRFNKVYAAYSMRFRQMHGRTGMDKLTLQNYLRNSPAFIAVRESVRFDTQVTSAWIFNYKALGINLERIMQPTEQPPQSTVTIPENKQDIVTGNSADQKELPY